MPSLTHLNLNKNNISEEGLLYMMKNIDHFPNILKLHLCKFYIVNFKKKIEYQPLEKNIYKC